MKEYMLMRGNITSVTLVMKKVTSGKIVRRKLKPSFFVEHDKLAYWHETVEIDKYPDILEDYIRKGMAEYVKRKYKGKYEYQSCEDLEFKERNLRMSSLPVNECMEYMTVEQFQNQFGPIRSGRNE